MSDMRRLMADSVAGARDMLLRVATGLASENTMTDDEQLREYEPMRGDPMALIQFTVQRLGPGVDALAEAERYENAMERLWDKRTR